MASDLQAELIPPQQQPRFAVAEFSKTKAVNLLTVIGRHVWVFVRLSATA